MTQATFHIISKEYHRYAGDGDGVLGLLFLPFKSALYLMYDGDYQSIEVITTHPEYIQWLQHFSYTLLSLEEGFWWNKDRNNEGMRYREFHTILKEITAK